MYRYVALISNPTSLSQRSDAEELSLKLRRRFTDYAVALKRQELVCFTAGHQPAVGDSLLKQSGIVVGSIFRRHDDPRNDDPCPPARFDDDESETIMKSHGRALIDGYWGSYVAILANDQTHSVQVVKDPAGSLPCYITRWHGISVIFSCLQDCLEVGLRFTVNESYVEARIASNGADLSRAALNEVVEVRRGECIEIATEGASTTTSRFYWLPMSFCARDKAIVDVGAASEALRATVRSVTRTLAQDHTDIHLRLSGGLDSSIIAGCLQGVGEGAAITAYTSYSMGGRSSERRWARLSAAQARFDHIELPIDPARLSLDAARHMHASVEPTASLVAITRDQVEQTLAMRNAPTAIFSGHGGDSAFGAEAIRHVIDDYLRLHGLSFKVLRIAADVARHVDNLAWTVLKDALVRWRRGSNLADFRDRMLNKQSLAAAHLRRTAIRTGNFPHPWFCGDSDVPWHVIRRVGALIFPPVFYSPLHESTASRPVECAPLYTQPVTELSLKIPLYLHFVDGIERGLARKAFQVEVPAPILRRQWKDRAPGHFETLALRNRAHLRDVVLGGALAQSRLIDCDAIEDILSGKLAKGAYFVGELFALFDTELWLRHFSQNSLPVN